MTIKTGVILAAILATLVISSPIHAKSEKLNVIDVRPEAEFAREHIAGARNIRLEEMPRHLAEMKDKSIVFYCSAATCQLAVRSALDAIVRGYDARVLLGGLETWKLKGFAVEPRAWSRGSRRERAPHGALFFSSCGRVRLPSFPP